MVELGAVVLHGCSVERGDADHTDPGKVSSDVDIHPSYDDDGLVYLVSTTHRFDNKDGQRIVDIASSFVAAYEAPSDVTFTEDEVEEHARTWVMPVVAPFIREFLASMTNRLGMPVFFLPLVHLDPTIQAGWHKRAAPPGKAGG
ncbi:MAG TPA: hypothetical protein VJT31_02955 [Rugosimonospora sp.]|nr:hypothetical protein [Rugosimonospora sp.]